MCSKSGILVGLLLIVGAPGSVVAQDAGNRFEFAMHVDGVDFDRQIRFDDEAGVSAQLLADLWPGFSMGLELAHVGTADRERDALQDIVTISIRGRVEPWHRSRLSAGAILGVSFMTFENLDNIDSVSEGFEIGPGLRWNHDETWRVRAGLIFRVQTVNRPTLDDAGVPTGESDDIGFVWTRLWRIGVGRAF